MALLANADFDNPPNKKADKGEYKGLSRYDIVEAKIKAGRDFFLGPKGDEGKVTGVSFNRLTKQFTYKTQTSPIQTVTVPSITGKAGNIFKDTDFSGGGGAGLGTTGTDIAESLQCVYCQLIVSNPDIDFIDITNTKLRSAYQKCDVSGTFEEMMKLPNDWKLSAYWSAKKLYDQGYIKNTHVFHRDSTKMKLIYSKADQAFVSSGLMKMKPDKWNPADIFAIDKNFSVAAMPTSTIQEYNAALLKAYKSKMCIGISLKKVERETGTKTSEVNLLPDRPMGLTLNQVRAKGTTTRSNFYSNKGGAIDINMPTGVKQTFEVRANSAFGTLKAEISGKTARQGGAGWGVIAGYVSDFMPATYKLPTNDGLKAEARQINNKNSQKIKSFYEKAKYISDDIKDLDEFTSELKTKDLAWIHAKLGVTYLLYALKKNKANKKADKVVNSIYNYAGSQSQLSSVHMKVYE